LLVVHCAMTTDPSRPARVGFVVSRAVGGSVVRHRVVRRLRALTAGRLSRIAPSTDLVVRANPAAATASFDELARALDAALSRACPGAS
jgi:ribonuclease P protein component